jgi:hypothetical protein
LGCGYLFFLGCGIWTNGLWDLEINLDRVLDSLPAAVVVSIRRPHLLDSIGLPFARLRDSQGTTGLGEIAAKLTLKYPRPTPA